MAVTVSGMFSRQSDGLIHTYFADSPVVIDISGLEWSKNGGSVTSPFTIVRVEVLYNNNVVGDFRADTGGQSSVSFDISSALRAIWSDYSFRDEVAVAQQTLQGSAKDYYRAYRNYSLHIYTEYLDSTDGEFTVTQCEDKNGNKLIPGGVCAIGGLTEWERYTAPSKEAADVSYREHKNNRNGDASTKPTDTPERVGKNSITSWVDLDESDTISIFYPANTLPAADSTGDHAPIVLRDNQEYVDFLFVNRRGAVETCSGLTKEALAITVEKQDYTLVERPAFRPTRSLMSLKQSDPRRSWDMSSGLVDREWAEWWAMEFLPARRHWMLYKGRYVPVIVTPAKKAVSIYDRAKQQMPHVDFTVTLALEG